MRTAPEKLESIVRTTVEAMGYELVGVELAGLPKSGLLLRVYIDHENGITLDDCGAVSHQISGVLDVEDPIAEHYDLEISSPGLDRPLFTKEHFERFKGRKVKVKLNAKLDGRRKIVGLLKGTEDESVLVEQDSQVYRLPLTQIETARLEPEF